MEIHESGEDYLEVLLILKERLKVVHSIDIATELKFAKPSVSRAVNILKEQEFITMQKNGELDFTEKGLRRAQEIFERHKILTSFFVKIGVREEIAQKDACKIEHDISEETYEMIKKFSEN